jgi:hypothetical protein
MARFSNFKKATPWAAPKLAAATADQGRLDAEAAARDNEIRAQNQQGLAQGYQYATKDMATDPIADSLRGGWDAMTGGGAAATPAVETGIGTMTPEALAGAEAAFAADATTTAGMATAAGTAAPAAGAGAAGAGAAGGAGVTAALASNPVGWGIGTMALLAALYGASRG